MKILIIDKNAGIYAGQLKFLHFEKFQDVKISVLCPQLWKSNYTDIPFQVMINAPVQWFTGKVIFRGFFNRAFYTEGLKKSLQESKPDFVLMMEEPFSLFALQSVISVRLFSPLTKIVFYTWHNYSYYPARFGLISQIYKLINKLTLSQADYGLVANPEAAIILHEKGFQKPIKLVPYGVEISSFTSVSKLEARSKFNLDGIVIGYVGRLIEAKGIFDLLEAFARLNNNTTLMIVGDGPSKEKLIHKINQLGLNNRVKFLGILATSDIPLAMNACDVVVLPSKTTYEWKEQFGRVLVEAMSARVPVIGSSSGAIPWVIGDAGLTFQEGNVDELVEKLSLICNDSSLRFSLGEKGYKRAINEFSWEQFAQKIYEISKVLVKTTN